MQTGLQIAELIDQLIFIKILHGPHPEKGSTEERQVLEAKLRVAAALDEVLGR